MDLEFHPFRQTRRSGEAGEADGLLGIHRATGVGKDQVPFGIDELEDVGKGILLPGEIGTAQGDGHHFGARLGKGIAHGFRGRKFARAQEKARLKGATGDDERFRRHYVRGPNVAVGTRLVERLNEGGWLKVSSSGKVRKWRHLGDWHSGRYPEMS